MNLKEKLNSDYIAAMKDKDLEKVSVLRLLKTAIKNAEIDKMEDLDEAGVIAVIEKQAKQRKDSIEQYTSAGRDDLREIEEAELVIISSYLPEKMSYEEVLAEVKNAISSLSEEDQKNFGKAMGASMAVLKGKADPQDVNKAVKEALEV